MEPIRARTVRLLVVAAVLTTMLGACGRDLRTPPPQMPDAHPDRGARAIARYGCGSCHTIPGIRDADATVGPPLTRFAERGFIAGRLQNTPDNLVRWISDPQGVEPGTAMPDLRVTDEDARDIAAYLYTLR